MARELISLGTVWEVCESMQSIWNAAYYIESHIHICSFAINFILKCFRHILYWFQDLLNELPPAAWRTRTEVEVGGGKAEAWWSWGMWCLGSTIERLLNARVRTLDFDHWVVGGHERVCLGTVVWSKLHRGTLIWLPCESCREVKTPWLAERRQTAVQARGDLDPPEGRTVGMERGKEHERNTRGHTESIHHQRKKWLHGLAGEPELCGLPLHLRTALEELHLPVTLTERNLSRTLASPEDANGTGSPTLKRVLCSPARGLIWDHSSAGPWNWQQLCQWVNRWVIQMREHSPGEQLESLWMLKNNP